MMRNMSLLDALDLAWTPARAFPRSEAPRAFLPEKNTDQITRPVVGHRLDVSSSDPNNAIFFGPDPASSHDENTWVASLIAMPEFVGALQNSLLQTAARLKKGQIKILVKFDDLPSQTKRPEATQAKPVTAKKTKKGTGWLLERKKALGNGNKYCINCKANGHWLYRCTVPLATSPGSIVECPVPLCQTRDKRHHLDERPILFPPGGYYDFAAVSLKDLQYFVSEIMSWDRVNMPQFRGEKFSAIDYFCRVGYQRAAPNHQVAMPWTDNHAVALASGDALAGGYGLLHPSQFDPNVHRSSDLPEDPFWKNKTWEDVVEAYKNDEYDHFRCVFPSTIKKFANELDPYNYALKSIIEWTERTNGVVDFSQNPPRFQHPSALPDSVRNEAIKEEGEYQYSQEGPFELMLRNRGCLQLIRLCLLKDAPRNGIRLEEADPKEQFYVHAPVMDLQIKFLLKEWVRGTATSERGLNVETNPIHRAFSDILTQKVLLRTAPKVSLKMETH
ncbi:hypothetical protein QBC34DRAFT_160811 [Podospora aff. communis PSN243]|uniref:CCHC-type domain-containing protein n=1 Tax=Podospora aff. communis PSN243 TaxID=3040156 RepID=A0AAV9GC90_9PEZI|nr:hypothetical protein QBC34DRAFT_160811 [Podospora aff. communis PSN243]